MKVNDLISGMLVLGLSVFLFLEAETFVSMPGVPYGPKMFPQIISAIMGGAGVLLIVSSLRTLPNSRLLELDDWARKPRSYVILATIIGGVLYYIFAAKTLGFLVTTSTMLIVLLTVTRGVKRLPQNLAIAVAFSGIIFLVFSYVLRVPLPIGFAERLIFGYS